MCAGVFAGRGITRSLMNATNKMQTRDSIVRSIARLSAAALFISSGVMHFSSPKLFSEIVPPQLPDPKLLVAISGIAEIAGGIGLLLPRLRRTAGWGLVALLLAVFPANVYMAVEAHRGRRWEVFGRVAPEWSLWLRLPLQAVLILWVVIAADSPDDRNRPGFKTREVDRI